MHFAVNIFELIALSVFTLKLSDCHPNGAPVAVCDNLLPGHEVQPQASKSPFVLKGRPKNHSIELIIESKDNTSFRGFAIQARPANATSGAIGKFLVKGNEMHAITCFGNTDNTITHSDRSEKHKITVEWIPPIDHEHDIQMVFVGTVVKTTKQFWTNLLSEAISLNSHEMIEGNAIEDHSQHNHNKASKTDHNSHNLRNSSPNRFYNYFYVLYSFVLLILCKF